MNAHRLLPAEPLPPYAFVPGQSPHPISDPAGHSYGLLPEQVAAPDPRNWQACRPYLRGVDLFNLGFYWEAHEVWESVWHACGRRGIMADFFKALIKLAAAGVKIRECRPHGTANHARRAAELLEGLRKELGEPAKYFGLDLAVLQTAAGEVAARPPLASATEGAMVVFAFTLEPHPLPPLRSSGS